MKGNLVVDKFNEIVKIVFFSEIKQFSAKFVTSWGIVGE
jgi:hypothetical protein